MHQVLRHSPLFKSSGSRVSNSLSLVVGQVQLTSLLLPFSAQRTIYMIMSANYNWQAVHPVYGVPISVVQATEQPAIRCDVRQRHNLPSRSWAVRISTWINTNYFLWSLCAGLAGYRSDEEWTNTFEIHYSKDLG